MGIMTSLRVLLSTLYCQWCRRGCQTEFIDQIPEYEELSRKNVGTYSRSSATCPGHPWPSCRHPPCCSSTPCSIRARPAGSAPAAVRAQLAAEDFWCGAWPARSGASRPPGGPLPPVAGPTRIWLPSRGSSRRPRADGRLLRRGWTSLGRGRSRWSDEVDGFERSRRLDLPRRLRWRYDATGWTTSTWVEAVSTNCQPLDSTSQRARCATLTVRCFTKWTEEILTTTVSYA